jgi:hypothetical protein
VPDSTAIEDSVIRLQERLRELKPALEEAARIEAALTILAGNGPRRSAKEIAFINYVRDHPRAPATEIADALKTKPSYVTRLQRKLFVNGELRGGGNEPWTVLDVLKPVPDESANGQ